MGVREELCAVGIRILLQKPEGTEHEGVVPEHLIMRLWRCTKPRQPNHTGDAYKVPVLARGPLVNGFHLQISLGSHSEKLYRNLQHTKCARKMRLT